MPIQPQVPGLGQFPAVMSLSGLNGGNGFELDGVSANDNTGSSVSAAGDVNHDGIADIIIGAQNANSGNAGKTYVVFGKASAWTSSISLGTLNGTNGFELDGVSGDRSGSSANAAGDVNNDGIADIIIGAYNANSQAGKTYVVFGKASAWTSPISLSTLNGANGFELDGVSAVDQSGLSVSAAGDINNDGIADIIIGAPFANSSAGKIYVVFGKASAWSSPISLNTTLNVANGFELDGVAGYSGWPVSAAGDVNNDGIADIIIGAPYANSQAGKTYVVFGKASGWTSPTSLSTLNGANGFELDGVSANDNSGSSVNVAGDVNNDGIADIIIGAYNANSGAGKTYVVFGKASGWMSPISLSTLNGANGFELDGVSANDYSGSSVSAAGDVNNDGIADIIIGAFRANSFSGKTYVVFGKASGWSSPISLGTLNGANGFELDGVSADDRSGYSVSTAGDVNNDGIADIIIGAVFANTAAGKAYVVFGDSPPVLANNTLTIGAGCTVTLDSTYLAAYDLNNANSTLMFTASNVTNGNFQKNVLGVVTSLTMPFLQSDITAGYIQFVSTNGNAPSYSMAVSGAGLGFVPATPAVVSFSAPCTEAPTQAPSLAPSVAPTAEPTLMPTAAPTFVPTVAPTVASTLVPTVAPSLTSTAAPNTTPAFMPTVAPSLVPTAAPSFNSEAPTQVPTTVPTIEPSFAPSFMPSFNSEAPTRAPSFAPSDPVVSSAARMSPAWFLPVSQVVSLLDTTTAAYESAFDYLSGSDAYSKPVAHNAPYDASSLRTMGAQLMLGAVALKLAQKGISWAKSFWASEPDAKPALSKGAESLQTPRGSDAVSQPATAEMKHLSEKVETYQACLEETSVQSNNVVYPDFQKPGINFAYNSGARKRMPSTVERATVANTRLATLSR